MIFLDLFLLKLGKAKAHSTRICFQGKCQVNLDEITGEIPPLLLQNGDFVYPTKKTEEDKRIMTFGKKNRLKKSFTVNIL